MVRRPQGVSHTLLAFQPAQASLVDVPARKNAGVILDPGKNPETECGGGTPGGARKRPSQEDFAREIVVFRVDVSGQQGLGLLQDCRPATSQSTGLKAKVCAIHQQMRKRIGVFAQTAQYVYGPVKH
jgi:hypothetical protein